MKIVAIMSQKGGAGKTTLALNLAIAGHVAGQNVGVVDLDPQQSSATWGDQRESPPSVISGQAARLGKLAEAAKAGGADLLLIDSAPGKDSVHLAIASAADLILVPCRPSVLDVQAIMPTFEITRMAGRPAHAVFNAAPTSSPYLVTQGREALASWEIATCPIVIHQRLAFATSYAAHQGVIESEPSGKAAQEVRELHTWLSKQLALKAPRKMSSRR